MRAGGWKIPGSWLPERTAPPPGWAGRFPTGSLLLAEPMASEFAAFSVAEPVDDVVQHAGMHLPISLIAQGFLPAL